MCKLWGNSYVSSQGIFALPHNVSWVVNSDLAFLPFNRSLQLYSSNINWNIFSECILEFCKCRNILNAKTVFATKKSYPGKRFSSLNRFITFSWSTTTQLTKICSICVAIMIWKCCFLVFSECSKAHFLNVFLICEHLKG